MKTGLLAALACLLWSTSFPAGLGGMGLVVTGLLLAPRDRNPA